MMGFIDFFKKKQTRFLMPDISYFNTSNEWSFDNDDKSSKYIENGYKTLPNVYGLISAILQKSTIVPFEVYKVKSRSSEQKYKALMSDGKNVAKALMYKAKAYDQVYDTDLEQLLLKPNGYQSRQDYLWEVDGYKLLTGNSYVYTLKLGNKSKELHPIPSPFVDLIVKGIPFSPEFKYRVSYLKDLIEGDNILHFKYWNPVTGTQNTSRQFLGQSPLQSCRMLLGRYKDADVTQGFMFKNQGPGGLLTGDKDTNIRQEEAIALQDRFRQQHTGTHKANDIIITPSKLSWTSIGLSPVDLNIIAGKKEMTEELCNAYNYPSDLLGGDKKYNNFEQARRAVITDVIIPLCESRKEVENKIAKQFGDYVIEYDYTVFHELQEDLEKLARTMAIIEEITPNEKRTALGYDQLKDPNMDKIYFRTGKVPLDDLNAQDEEIDEDLLDPSGKKSRGYDPSQPRDDRGRWTDGSNSNSENDYPKITKDNFHVATLGRFKRTERPDKEPDYVSLDKNGNVSSEYWYSEEGVIRHSDHWGDVASTTWVIDDMKSQYYHQTGEVKIFKPAITGKITFSELQENTHRVLRANDTYMSTLIRVAKEQGKESFRDVDKNHPEIIAAAAARRLATIIP